MKPEPIVLASLLLAAGLVVWAAGGAVALQSLGIWLWLGGAAILGLPLLLWLLDTVSGGLRIIPSPVGEPSVPQPDPP